MFFSGSTIKIYLLHHNLGSYYHTIIDEIYYFGAILHSAIHEPYRKLRARVLTELSKPDKGIGNSFTEIILPNEHIIAFIFLNHIPQTVLALNIIVYLL